jgi:hypothetical protein
MIRWHISEAGTLVLQDDRPEGDRMQVDFPSFDELIRFARGLSAGALAAANRTAERNRDNAFVREFPKLYGQ